MSGGRAAQGRPSQVRDLFERVHARPEDAEGARRLLYEFVSSPDLVRMLCASDPDVDPSELVRPGRITVISGDASALGEATTRRLFAVYLAILWSELMARSPSPKTFVLLDEVHWFGHETLGEMLRLGRRFNTHVVLGTQSLKSLPAELADAVRTNVADWLLFRGSPDDLREIARSVPGLLLEDILALSEGQAVFLEGKGRTVRFVNPAHSPGEDGRPWKWWAESKETGGRSGTSSLRVESLAEPAATASGHRVYLEDLVRSVDAGPFSLREWGGELGRRGAIRARGTDSRGAYWDLTEAGYRWLQGRRPGRP